MSALQRMTDYYPSTPSRNEPTTRPVRLPSKVSRQVDQASYHGLVGAARVQASAYVTHNAMQHVAMLSAEEGHLIEMSPLAERRLKVLVDQFTANAAFEIQRMGW